MGGRRRCGEQRRAVPVARSRTDAAPRRLAHGIDPPSLLPIHTPHPTLTLLPPPPPQVWGHIVEEDLQRLGQFAREFEAGQLGRRAAHLPFTLEWLYASPAVPVGAA